MTAPSELSWQAQRLTRLYILALAAVACLSLLGQVLVQWSLERQQSDSTVVNLAGRQRMLSQRLTKAALALERATTAQDLTARRSEMTEVLAQWRYADDGLRRGSKSLGLPGRNSLAVQQMFAALEPHFQAMGSAADEMIRSNSASQRAIESLLANEPRFLDAMDAIVRQFELEARSRVAWLKGTERGLLLITLLVLACEGTLIFYPAVRRLRRAAAAMEESRRQLEVAKQQADSANEAKSQFLATISHELRNPLQAILGSVELAAKATNDPEQQEHLETISTAARTQLVLFNDLLDLARIEAGKLNIVAAPFDALHLTKRMLAMVNPQAMRQGLRLEHEIHGEVPTSLAGDELRVRQVLLNLLTNALKFTSSGKICVRLSVFEQREDFVRLRWEVRDTGIGIAPEQQGAIFEAFTQVAAAPGAAGGAGLGLTICRRLVGLMQGTIGVESTPGSGSTFWFELPLTRVECGDKLQAIGSQLISGCPPLTVLIVDDDPVNRRLLTQLVEALGHRAVAVGTGEEAITKFRTGPYDAAILDWHLPDIDGGHLATELRTLAANLKKPCPRLVALSAAIENTGGHRPTSSFDVWLTKPVGMAELAKAIGTADSSQASAANSAERWRTVLGRLGGRRELLQQLAQTWSATLPDTLERLQLATKRCQFEQISKLSHLLAGQASNFNDQQLVAAAKSLESSSQARILDEPSVANVASQCERLTSELAVLLIDGNGPK